MSRYADKPYSAKGSETLASQPAIAIQKLARWQSPAIVSHLSRLPADDRRLRFGSSMSDRSLEGYVAGIDFFWDKVFGIFAPDLSLIAMAHVALDSTQGFAELGLSVDPAERGKGYGNALLQRAIRHAANAGCRTLFMHCLSENQIIVRLARKAGLKVVIEHGEANAHMALDEKVHGGLTREAIEDQVALIDFLLKQQFSWLLKN